jgi:hypothetical protein
MTIVKIRELNPNNLTIVSLIAVTPLGSPIDPLLFTAKVSPY